MTEKLYQTCLSTKPVNISMYSVDDRMQYFTNMYIVNS